MRTLISLGCLLFLAGLPAARAQGLGIKGGLSYGNVSNSGVLPGNLGARTGFAAGVALATSSSGLGFGAEALYAQRGVTSSTGIDSRSLDYLDVPLSARVTLPTPGLAPFAYAGPMVSFELRCRAGGVACPDTGRPKRSYAAVIGAGVSLGGRGVSLEGRYIYGLTDLKLNTITSSASYHSRSFLILAGVPF
jgi:Outer membrane protein beta-barrel domain